MDVEVDLEIEIEVEYGLSVEVMNSVSIDHPSTMYSYSTAWCNASTRIYPMKFKLYTVQLTTPSILPSFLGSIVISRRLEEFKRFMSFNIHDV